MTDNNMEQNYDSPIFNMGVAYLMRIDFIQRKMNDFAIMADFDNWFRSTKTLYRELFPLMNDDEKKKFKDIESKCRRQEVKNYKKLIVFNENELEKLDVSLRKVIERQKWINPKGDDPRYSVLG